MDGAAQDELVTDGPGQYIGSNSSVSGNSNGNDRISSLMRSISPMNGIAASSGTSSSSFSEVQLLPVAENWCHTQVPNELYF